MHTPQPLGSGLSPAVSGGNTDDYAHQRNWPGLSAHLARLALSAPCTPARQKADPADEDDLLATPCSEGPDGGTPFKKTRRGKRAGRNLKQRNAESEQRRRSTDQRTSLERTDSPSSWTPQSQTDPYTPRGGMSSSLPPGTPMTPYTAPATPMTVRATSGGLQLRTAPCTPPAGSTVWAPPRAASQAISPWETPTHLPGSPALRESRFTPERRLPLSPLDSLDSAYDGKADAAWGGEEDGPRPRMLGPPGPTLRSSGSAPASVSRSRRLDFSQPPLWPTARHSIAARPEHLPRIDSQQVLGPLGPSTPQSPLPRVPTWEAMADADGLLR